MKKIIAVILCCIACLSCQSQGKTDLEKTDFSKNYKDILKGARVKTEAREMVTTLPIAYTPDVSNFTFGNIAFKNSRANAIKSSSVGVLINNTTERLTEGIKIEVEDTAAGNELLAYLKSKYKAPKVLAGIPGKNSEGKVLGNSAYAWTLRDKTLVLVQYYEYTNNKPDISSVLFMVDNKATAPELQQNVASRIIKTFTP